MLRRDVLDRWLPAGIALLLAAALLLPLVASDSLLRIVTQALLLAYLAQTWNIAGGFAGQFSLGHAAFVGIGAYTSTLLLVNFGVSPLLGLLLGAALSGALGYLISRLTSRFRIGGMYFALFTLALAIVIESVVTTLRFAGRASGILLPLYDSPWSLLFEGISPYYLIILAMVAGMAIVTAKLKNSRMGRLFEAIREDEVTAKASGVDIVRYKASAMGLSSLLAALGGTFFAQFFRYVSPDTVFAFDPIMLDMLLGTIVGGAGTVAGPILGGALFSLLGEVLRAIPLLSAGSRGNVFVTMLYGAILILTIQYLRGGLVSLFDKTLPRSEAPRSADHGGDNAPTRLPAVLPTHSVEAGEVRSDGRRAILQVSNASKHFGGLKAVDGVSFDVEPGEVLGLIGPNGAGKTTLFNCISGFMPLSSGTIAFRGNVIAGTPEHRLCKQGLARTFQITRPFPDLTAQETVAIGLMNRMRDGSEAFDEAAELLRGVRFAAPLGTKGSDLSVVNRKRLEFARALATGPQLLLLDEICAGLNPEEIQDVLELIEEINAAGVTIIMVEHVMQAVLNAADRMLVLDHGKLIASGGPASVMNDSAVVEAYLGRKRGMVMRTLPGAQESTAEPSRDGGATTA